jgi:cyclopropane-fatty-acyl-phospholipid synthase
MGSEKRRSMSLAYKLLESGKIPDVILRLIIKGVSYERLWSERKSGPTAEMESLQAFKKKLLSSPIALVPEMANEQHYEVPAEFYALALGHRRKYSSAYFPLGVNTLNDAEDAMLKLTCERAQLSDGIKILELGCGWGSLTLWMAEKYPNAQIVGVSNSASQREYILGEAATRGLSNVRILTADINSFSTDEKFDRVVSVEMFEHLRNWGVIFERIRTWLNEDGKLFFHIFTHKVHAYEYETEGTSNWLGKYFFTGGMMPSDSLPLYFADHFSIENHWRLPGTHYGKTAEGWYSNLLVNREKAEEVFARTYPNENPKVWFERWKIFFLACAEMFALRGGSEWLVSHYLFKAR